MFASLTTVTVPVPLDPPNTLTIRKLTGKELDLAQAANLKNAASGVLGRNWAERVKRQMRKGIDDVKLKSLTPAELAERENDAALVELDDPMNGFDRYEVIRLGLVAWSYDVPARPVASKTQKTDADGKALPASKAAAEEEVAAARMKAIEDLDDEGADFVAGQIMRLTKPALYQTAEEREAAQKNG